MPAPSEPPSERLAARLGRQARQRAPISRARRLAWLAFALLLVGLLVAQLIFRLRPPWVHRLEQEKRQEQTKPAR